MMLFQGHSIVVYDVDTSAAKVLASKGATVASSPQDVAAQSDEIVTMLPNNDIVRDVYAGKDGILGSVKAGSLLVDSSTIDPAVSQEVAAMCKEKGATFVDAPVSGGTGA